MPYKFDWDDGDQTIIRLEMFDDVTWEQYHRVIDEIIEVIHERSPQRIDLILHERTPMPKGNAIANLKNSLERLSSLENLGNMVVVTEKGIPNLAQPFARIVNSMYDFNFRHRGGFFETMDEARQFIMKNRARNDT